MNCASRNVSLQQSPLPQLPFANEAKLLQSILGILVRPFKWVFYVPMSQLVPNVPEVKFKNSILIFKT